MFESAYAIDVLAAPNETSPLQINVCDEEKVKTLLAEVDAVIRSGNIHDMKKCWMNARSVFKSLLIEQFRFSLRQGEFFR